MATIEEFLAQSKLPEAALKPITDKVNEYIQLVVKNNKLVAQINAAKAQDPSNVDYLDSLWKANEQTDNEIAPIAEQFYAIAEEYEKLNKQLREMAKKHIPEQLGEEETKNARKSVNDAAPTIETTRRAAIEMLSIPESMLTVFNVEMPEGGLAALLPQAESLKNVRGRKATTASGEAKSYATRVGDILINGESTQINGKGKIAYAAEKLSEMWNAQNVPTNKVVAEDIERAYFESLPGEIEFRGLKSTELPDEHSFTFERTIKVQNKNDDSYTDVPQKVKLTLRSTNYGTTTESENPAVAKVDAEGEKVKPEPAKKAAPAKPATK